MKIVVTYSETNGNKTASITVENSFNNYDVAMHEKELLWKMIQKDVRKQIGISDNVR